MEYIDAQMEVCKARILYWNAMILSGAYAHRKMFKLDNTPLTEDELLDDAMIKMNTFIHRLQSLADSVPIVVEDGPAG